MTNKKAPPSEFEDGADRSQAGNSPIRNCGELLIADPNAFAKYSQASTTSQPIDPQSIHKDRKR